VVRPEYRSSIAIWGCDHGRVGNGDPLVVHEDLIVTITASPVTILQRVAVAESATQLAALGFQLLEPTMHFRVGLRVFPVEITG